MKYIFITLLAVFISSPSWSKKNQKNSIKNSPAQTEKETFQGLELFNKVLYLVQSKYYKNVETKKLIEGALNGLMNTLDPHSSFLSGKIFKQMEIDTSGEFGGIGIEVTIQEGVILVITPIEGSPAEKAGIKSQDRIIEIDGKKTFDMSLDQSIEVMRGAIGSKVKLGILREGEKKIRYMSVSRQKIVIKPVKYELIDDQYAYLRLSAFQNHSTQFLANALKKMKKKAKEFKGIILDLRSNPGGLLEEAVGVSSLFLKEGKVVSTVNRLNETTSVRYVNKGGLKISDVPLAVLINGASASASEIVAGALQDHERAFLMGQVSFGKGTVQTIVKLDKESGVKLTIAQYLTPKGRKIQAKGVKPDIVLEDFDLKDRKDSSHMREKDLPNHLKAEEKRKDKIAAGKKFKPSSDYQVMQALKYLKSLPLIKKKTVYTNFK